MASNLPNSTLHVNAVQYLLWGVVEGLIRVESCVTDGWLHGPAADRPQPAEHAQIGSLQAGLRVLLLVGGLLAREGRVPDQLLQENLGHLIAPCRCHIVALLGRIRADLHEHSVTEICFR